MNDESSPMSTKNFIETIFCRQGVVLGYDIDQSSIIDRFIRFTGCKSDKEIASMIKTSSKNYGHRKKRVTLLPLFTVWAIHNDVDLNWFLKGTNQKTSNNNNMFVANGNSSIGYKGNSSVGNQGTGSQAPTLTEKIAQLKELGTLKSNGVIDDHEFEKLKQELLETPNQNDKT